MMTTLMGIGLALMPFIVIIALLKLADHLVSRRNADYVRQIALTDAIHQELGAAAAPEVRSQSGEWMIRVSVPLERPSTVAAIVRIINRVFSEGAKARPFRIVLTPLTPR